jgi:hypothetical protein
MFRRFRSTRSLDPRRHDEGGAALAMALVMTVALAMITTALASYAMTGSKRSVSASTRLAVTTEAESIANWYVEELTYRRAQACTAAPDPNGPLVSVAIPAKLTPPSGTVTLTCQSRGRIDGYPVVDVVATVARGARSQVSTRVQVSTFQNVIAILAWKAT